VWRGESKRSAHSGLRSSRRPSSPTSRRLYLEKIRVDEAGYLPVESREAYLFIQFISYRYEKSSTILTLLHCPVFGEYLSLNVYQCLDII
jgi:hypothetical protein